MKYVVIDLEMNPIATVHTAEREYCKLEVIEIGAVLLDEKYQEIGSFVTLVKPRFNSRIEKRYEKLTGIKTEMIESAPCFEDALDMFFKPGIKYDSPKNEFTNRMVEPMLNPPIYTFLYPALDSLHTDVSKAVFYSKNEKVSGKAGQIVSALFGTEIPLSPSSQIEGFHDLLQNAYDKNVPYESVCGIYEHLQETLIDMQLSGEDVKLSNTELVNTIMEYGDVSKEKLEQLKETASDYEGCSFSVSNLVPSKVNIDTAGISIKTEIEKLSRIERRVIDGIDYYLIPVNSSSIDDILLANKHSK